MYQHVQVVYMLLTSTKPHLCSLYGDKVLCQDMLVLKTVKYNYLRVKNVICFAFSLWFIQHPTFYKVECYKAVFSIKLSGKAFTILLQVCQFIEKRKEFFSYFPYHTTTIHLLRMLQGMQYHLMLWCFRLRTICGAIPGNSRVQLQGWMLSFFLILTGHAFIHCFHQCYLFSIISILLVHLLRMLCTTLFT